MIKMHLKKNRTLGFIFNYNEKKMVPLEAQRGAHAIYTAKSIMGLMKMAHIAEIQGFNL